MQFDSASEALIELAASRHNAFTTSEAADLGIKLRRLQDAELRGELYRLYPKVWSFGALPGSPYQNLRAANLARPCSAASLKSAAWLHGWLEVPPPEPQLWTGATRRRQLAGASVRQFGNVDRARDVVKVDHVDTLNMAATLCLLGADCSVDVLERCLDEFLRTESERWLDATLQRLYTPNSPGPYALRTLLEDPNRVPGIPDSVMERVTANLLVSPDLPPLVLQHQLQVDGQRFRLDVACPDLQLGIEYHSRRHHWGPSKADADNQRDFLIASIGWEVIYVTHSMLRDPKGMVRRFQKTAETRAAQLGVSRPRCNKTGGTT